MSVARRRHLHRRADHVPPTGETRAQILRRLLRRRRASSWPRRVAYADSTSRPADARGGRLPRGGEPRDPPGRHRPQARLAGGAVGEGARRPRPLLPIGPSLSDRHADAERRATGGAAGAMKALQIERKLARFAAARVAGSRCARARARRTARSSCDDIDPPELPGAGLGARSRRAWPGICGSDLATDRRHRQPLLRADRELPVHARPRGRGRHRRRRTTRRSCSSRCSAA